MIQIYDDYYYYYYYCINPLHFLARSEVCSQMSCTSCLSNNDMYIDARPNKFSTYYDNDIWIPPSSLRSLPLEGSGPSTYPHQTNCLEQPPTHRTGRGSRVGKWSVGGGRYSTCESSTLMPPLTRTRHLLPATESMRRRKTSLRTEYT